MSGVPIIPLPCCCTNTSGAGNGRSELTCEPIDPAIEASNADTATSMAVVFRPVVMVTPGPLRIGNRNGRSALRKDLGCSLDVVHSLRVGNGLRGTTRVDQGYNVAHDTQVLECVAHGAPGVCSQFDTDISLTILMPTSARDTIASDDLRGVFAVPPLPRESNPRRTLNLEAAGRVASHIASGGVTRYLYGGNAFLYHISLAEYEALLDWLADFPPDRWAIPSVGPSFGRALDQACLLRRHSFRCVMALPCADPRDALGLEAGLREIADASGLPLILYIKSEDSFGSNIERGLDAIGRLMTDGVAIAIKYAIVRDDPIRDAYLDGLLRRVDRTRVISGMGERPAIVHLRDFGLVGLTTGSGCIAPRRSRDLHRACLDHSWTEAEAIRARFMPLEDLRDQWGPARVLHHATDLAGIAPTGPILPYVSPLNRQQLEQLRPVARALREFEA